MVKAIASSDGINEEQAEACISSIRGQLVKVGKTTAEQYLELICDHVAATAGIGPNIAFNPLTNPTRLACTAADVERLE
ncbi:hypothetical protein [Massilia sp. CCM 8734]|uniref:hypothetical protein n=1 Tax=Massilia sp. CCM 8734 TaxID=2609283 RepID=UPI0014211FB0|nr:hypothetical protein [Massilia sp. CCM 8734]NIA00572.1 hypothetical protein [Massilia sp. CCM 8734]